MMWARFERVVLEGEFDSMFLFWPWLIATLVYLIVAPIRDRLDSLWRRNDTRQQQASKAGGEAPGSDQEG
jgi:hypothetical protein